MPYSESAVAHKPKTGFPFNAANKRGASNCIVRKCFRTRKSRNVHRQAANQMPSNKASSDRVHSKLKERMSLIRKKKQKVDRCNFMHRHVALTQLNICTVLRIASGRWKDEMKSCFACTLTGTSSSTNASRMQNNYT